MATAEKWSRLKARAVDALHDYAVGLIERGGARERKELLGPAPDEHVRSLAPVNASVTHWASEKTADYWIECKVREWAKAGRLAPEGYLRVITDWSPKPWTFSGIRKVWPHLDFGHAVATLVALDGSIEGETMEVQEQIIGTIRQIIQQELGRSEDVREIVRDEVGRIFLNVGALAKQPLERLAKPSPMDAPQLRGGASQKKPRKSPTAKKAAPAEKKEEAPEKSSAPRPRCATHNLVMRMGKNGRECRECVGAEMEKEPATAG